MKNLPFALVAIAIILLFTLPITVAASTSDNLYALTTKVVALDYENDTVQCEDFNGNIWEFYGCEDWAVGDVASMVMNDKGTEIIYDDEIESVRYNGWFEGWGQNREG